MALVSAEKKSMQISVVRWHKRKKKERKKVDRKNRAPTVTTVMSEMTIYTEYVLLGTTV